MSWADDNERRGCLLHLLHVWVNGINGEMPSWQEAANHRLCSGAWSKNLLALGRQQAKAMPAPSQMKQVQKIDAHEFTA